MLTHNNMATRIKTGTVMATGVILTTSPTQFPLVYKTMLASNKCPKHVQAWRGPFSWLCGFYNNIMSSHVVKICSFFLMSFIGSLHSQTLYLIIFFVLFEWKTTFSSLHQQNLEIWHGLQPAKCSKSREIFWLETTLTMLFKYSSVSWLFSLDLLHFKRERNCSQRYVLQNIDIILAAFIFIVGFFQPSILSKFWQECTCKCLVNN